MKRRELLQRITSQGCVFLRRGGRHDIYINRATGKKQPIPRHTEIDEHVARHIIRKLIEE